MLSQREATMLAFVLTVLTMTCDRPTGAVKIQCEPNIRIKRNCDLCTCNKDGTNLACSFLSCDQTMFPPGTIIETDSTVCTPGGYFAAKCNNCLCSLQGTDLACTRKLC